MRFPREWSDFNRTQFARTCSVSALLLLLNGNSSYTNAQVNELLKKQLILDAPAAWSAYEATALKYQGTIKTTEKLLDGQLYNQSIITLRQNAHNRLAEYRSLGPKAVEAHVYSYAQPYAFRLKESKANAYVITSFEEPAQPGGPIEQHLSEFHQVMAPLVRLSGFSLKDLINQPSFKIVRLAERADIGPECVLLEFDNRHSLSQKPLCQIQTGTLVLDRSHHWCLREAEFTSKYANADLSVSMTIHCYPDLGSILTPSRIVNRYTQNNPAFPGLLSATEQEWKPTDSVSPNSLFRLSAYGLPEPVGMKIVRHRVPAYIWFAAAGIVCLLSSILIRRAMRHILERQ